MRLDRAAIALVGATAMIVAGLVGFDEAVAAVDFRTIALLFGMMLVVGYLRLGGFFERLAAALLARARSPLGVLGLVVVLSGVLSAFLVNDVVCVALGPVVLTLARRLRRDPVPYLVALATAANVGSTATITGNPQNMIIGALSGIPYATFAARLAPVSAIGLALNFVVVALTFRARLSAEAPAAPAPEALARPGEGGGDADRRLLPRGIAVLAALVVLFFAGAPIAVASLGAGAVLLLGGVRPDRLYRQIDWSLLVMFAGLFVVVHGFERHVVSHWTLDRVAAGPRAPVAALTAASAVLSNLVSNVPAVLLLKSVVTSLAHAARTQAWLTLAMASTLSGNLTPIASVANLIVVEAARREGVELGLLEYCRVGVPLTLATVAVGASWLVLVG